MNNNTQKEISLKIVDYTRFSFVLFSLSIFLFMGTFLPIDGRTEFQMIVLYSMTYSALGFALFFYSKSKGLKRMLENENTKE